MKKIDGYWVDENGNRWNDCSKERAKELSSSMINCYNCNNCCGCHYCHNCHYCDNCRNCHNCWGCQYCRVCQDCEDCWDCRGCQKYTNSPVMYRSTKIGSREAQTLFYFGKTANGTSLQIVCGCFRGNLEEFEKAVLATHENNEVYRNQYLEEIRKVKALFGLEERGVDHEDMEIK